MQPTISLEVELKVKKLVRKKGKVQIRIDGRLIGGTFLGLVAAGEITHLEIEGKVYRILGVSARNGVLIITLEVTEVEADELEELFRSGKILKMKPSRVQGE